MQSNPSFSQVNRSSRSAAENHSVSLFNIPPWTEGLSFNDIMNCEQNDSCQVACFFHSLLQRQHINVDFNIDKCSRNLVSLFCSPH